MTTVSTLSIIDYSNEVSQMGVQAIELTAANFAAQQALRDAFFEATEDVILGVRVQTQTSVIGRNVDAAPTNTAAQRENKWLVSYRDNSALVPGGGGVANPGYGKYFNVEIPTADVTDASLFKAGSDEANWNGAGADTQWTDFAVDFQAYVRSPYGGLPLIVGIEFVGRRT